jgi:hypothetical protein
MSIEQKQAQQIAQQVLREIRERKRVAAVQRKHYEDDLARYQREIELICDDLVADGFTYGSEAMWEAAMRIMAARHVSREHNPLDLNPMMNWPVD